VTPSGPNLVLVVLDTARADLVGAHRDSAFSQLGRGGRRFLHAVAPAPWTLPSHVSILSGLRPSEHGVTGAAVATPAGPRSPRSAIEALTPWLPETLRRRGYATFCASGNPWVGAATGLTFGFDTVFEAWRGAPLPKLPDPLAVEGRTRRVTEKAAIYVRRAAGAGDGGAEASLRVFGSFLDGRDRRPFFAFFNVMEPHWPYAPPRGHADALGLTGRLAGLRAVRRWNAERMLRFCVGREEITDRDVQLLRSLYGGEIRYADAWLARLIETLSASGRFEDTVVAVTADHGENLGEHHRLSHVLSMHETLLHVPLAIAGPGVVRGEEPEPVGLTALHGTLVSALDGRWQDPAAAGVPAAEYESAAAQVSGARRLEDRVPPQDAGGFRSDLGARWFAAYEGSLKYTATSAGHERLVDLEADPGEARDVAREHPDAFVRLRAARGGAWAGDASASAGGIEAGLDAEITSHLEGLGYL
jgi:arylsulfatase A-like enzyme